MTPVDGQWGNVKKDGRVSGMIGMVARHEAHLAITSISISGEDYKHTVGIANISRSSFEIMDEFIYYTDQVKSRYCGFSKHFLS